MEWSPREDSPAARIDEEDYLRRCAEELARCEPPQRKTEAPVPNYVTEREFERTLQAIGRKIREVLDRELAKLEAKQLKVAGCWKAGERYAENTLVTYQGGLWISRAHTGARPGSGSPSWRLCVKKGDAR